MTENKKKKVNSEDVAVLNTYKYKFNKLNNSAEKIIYNRLRSFDSMSTGSLVENRRNGLAWVKHIEKLSKDVRFTMAREQLSGVSPVCVEQEKLKLLNAIGWFYNGVFYAKGEENAGDRVGYPNLSFTVSTRRLDDPSQHDTYTSDYLSDRQGAHLYAFVASYGIVEGIEQNPRDSGSYEVFLTLDECIDFISREFEFSHRETLYKKEMARLFDDFLQNSRGPRAAIARDISEKIKKASSYGEQRKITEHELHRFSQDKNNQKIVREYLQRLVPQSTIDREIYKLRRSTDVTALPDIVSLCFVPLAKKELADAEREQRETERASTIISSYRDDLPATPKGNTPSESRHKTPADNPLPEPPRRTPMSATNDQRDSVAPTPEPTPTPKVSAHVSASEPVSKVSSPAPVEVNTNADRIDVRGGVPFVETTRDYDSPIVVTPEGEKTVETNEYALPTVQSPEKQVEQVSEHDSISITPSSDNVTQTDDYTGVNVSPDRENTVVTGDAPVDVHVSPDDVSTTVTENAPVNVSVSPVDAGDVTVTGEGPSVTISAPTYEERVEDSFGGFSFAPDVSESEAVSEEDVLDKIRDVMPDLFDTDRTPVVDDGFDEIDDILNRFE